MTAPKTERITWGPWWRAAFIIVGLLGIAAITFAFWLNSDADLRAVERRAKAMGVPTTWKALGRTQSPPDVIARWERIVALLKLCPSWHEKMRISAHLPWPKSWIGVVPPTAMVEYHAGLDPVTLNEIDDLADQLDGKPICSNAEPNYAAPMFDIAETRDLTKLMAERAILADPSYVGAACVRLTKIVDRCEHHTFIADNVAFQNLEIALAAIAYRSPDLEKSTEKLLLITWLNQHGGSALDGLRELIAGQMIISMDLSRHLTAEYARRIGILLPYDGHFPFTLTRLSRKRCFVTLLNIQTHLADTGTLQSIIRFLNKLDDDRAASGSWDPRWYFSRINIELWRVILKYRIRSVIHCRLLTSHLDHEPLPPDPCDPAGGPLRPILRNGEMIGAYSLGWNLVDDGGDTNLDFCYPLTARLGSPNAADLPPVPKP